MYIYQIKNKVTGRVYIGQTSILLRKRRDRHYSELRRNCHTNKWLQSSWNKHGEANFVFECLECLIVKDKEYLAEREMSYINKTKDIYNLLLVKQVHYPKCSIQAKYCPLHIGHNKICKGRKHTKESREKISKNMPCRHKENNPFYGKTHTKKVKDKLSKLASKRKGKDSSFYGKNHTEESKKKMSDQAKRRLKDPTKHPSYKKETLCFFNKKTGDYVTLNRLEFKEYLLNKTGSTSSGNISNLIKGKLKSYKGYKYLGPA